MRLSPVALTVLIVISCFSIGQAQQAWVPQAIERLQEGASSKSGFTFDHSMLVLASKLDPDNEDLRRIIAGVDGLSVRTYHFNGDGEFDAAALSSVNQEYGAAGWIRGVNKSEKINGTPTVDAWVHMQNNAVAGLAFLVVKAKEVTFVAVSGSMSPIDLFHLSGHFGIPRIAGGVELPRNRAQVGNRTQ